MSLELVSTIATLVTAAVIAATAIAAIVQLKHLRAANQINALLAVQNELDSQDFREAEVIVREQMTAMLADPLYCRFEIDMARHQIKSKMEEKYLKVRAAANLIGNTFENIGSLVKNGILEERLIMDIYCWLIRSYWNDLASLTALSRAATGEPAIYENFEYLAVLAKRYLKAYPQTYPAGMERLEMTLPAAAKDQL